MIGGVDFLHPWVLAALPLALLPLARRGADRLPFPDLRWLPADPLGRALGVLWRALAATAIGSLVIALAAPGRAESVEPRTGRGAEILLLIDRSRSMDEHMLPSDWRELNPEFLRQLANERGELKSSAARRLLTDFVAQRPHDRFAVSFFSASILHAVPFTQHGEVVAAGIAAGGVGRGLSSTDVGNALISAIARFDHRRYTGSRIILLVSDGAAHLDMITQRAIEAGLQRNRVTLYWLYLKAFGRPDLNSAGAEAEKIPEVALHRFFESLPTPYRAYQAESPEDLAAAVAEVGRQQNFPLDFEERIPRRDHSRPFVAAGALACLALLGLSVARIRSWA